MKNDTGIQKYQAFIAVAETKNFTEAAQTLGYTQANISMMIRDLEKEWNLRLFDRGRTGVQLTSDGKLLLPLAQKICKDYGELKNEINEINGLQIGTIRIGTISSVATYILPKKIKEFKREYPNIDFEILLGDHDEIENWIESGRVDFGILRIPTKSNLVTQALLKDELVFIHSKDEEVSEDLIDLNDIMNYRFILLDKNRCSEVLELLDEYNVSPTADFVTWDDYAVMSMVEQGLGVSILPKLILSRIPFDINIKSFTQDCYRIIGSAYKESKNLSKASKKFLEKLKSFKDLK